MERVQPIGRERLPPLVTNWRIDRSIAPRAEGSRRGCSLKGSQAGGRSPTIGLLSSRKVSFTAVTAVRQQQPTLRRPHGAEGPCSDPLAASRSNRIPPSPVLAPRPPAGPASPNHPPPANTALHTASSITAHSA